MPRSAVATVEDVRRLQARAMAEDELQSLVLEMAKRYGWRSAHFKRAKLPGRGGEWRWMTPVAGDGKGFPDLVLLRDAVLLVPELKSERGTATPEQRAWLEAFRLVGAVVVVWRPRHWFSGEIERALRGDR